MKPRAGIIFGHCLLILPAILLIALSTGLPAKQANADTLKCETGTSYYNGIVGNITAKGVGGFPNDGSTIYWKAVPGNACGWGTSSAVRSFVNGP
ncbi:MAG: hypothetical protein WC169_09370 [Dehalococcoidia bacterium]|jgi:hypothetical protein